MRKRNIAITIGSIIIALGIYTYIDLFKEETIENREPIEERNTGSKAMEEFKNEGDNEPIIMNVPTAEEVAEEFPLDLSESQVQDYIHWMSHQKVAASDKWGKMLITQERIDRLIEVIEANDYDHRKVYLGILGRWQEGDFSRAHLDHNSMWVLQGGTIGRATGLLSAEEEQEYIDRHFGE